MLLLLLITAFLLSGLSEDRWPTALTAGVNLVVLLFGFASTGMGTRLPLLVTLGALGAAGASLVAAAPLGDTGLAIGALSQVVVLTVILGGVIGRILRHDRVGIPTILGAISAYFLIGLLFAWTYEAMSHFVGGAVLDPPEERFPAYYSFTVLTTLGFGDITPVQELAKRVTAIEAMAGQVFLATLVARLVSLFGEGRSERPS